MLKIRPSPASGRFTCCFRCHWRRTKVPLAQDAIERIGAREGWRTKLFGRGRPGQKPFFHVVEFWVENQLMVEIVSPAMGKKYEEFLTIERFDAMSEGVRPSPADAAMGGIGA